MKKILAVILVVALMAMPMVAMTGCEEEPSDPAIVALQSKVSALEGRASTLEGRASTLEGKVTGLGDTSALQSAITSLQVDLGSLSAELVILQAEVEGLPSGDWAEATAVAGLEEDVSGLKETVAQITTDIVTLNTELDGLKDRVEDLEALVGALEPTAEVVPYVTIDRFGLNGLELTVHRDGNFAVIITLYGQNLELGLMEVDDVDIAKIDGEFLYGQMVVTGTITYPSLIAPTAWPLTGPPVPVIPPADHTHVINLTGVRVDNVFSYKLSTTGTTLILVIIPGHVDWEAGDEFEVSFKGLVVNYVTIATGLAR